MTKESLVLPSKEAFIIEDFLIQPDPSNVQVPLAEKIGRVLVDEESSQKKHQSSEHLIQLMQDHGVLDMEYRFRSDSRWWLSLDLIKVYAAVEKSAYNIGSDDCGKDHFRGIAMLQECLMFAGELRKSRDWFERNGESVPPYNYESLFASPWKGKTPPFAEKRVSDWWNRPEFYTVQTLCDLATLCYESGNSRDILRAATSAGVIKYADADTAHVENGVDIVDNHDLRAQKYYGHLLSNISAALLRDGKIKAADKMARASVEWYGWYPEGHRQRRSHIYNLDSTFIESVDWRIYRANAERRSLGIRSLTGEQIDPLDVTYPRSWLVDLVDHPDYAFYLAEQNLLEALINRNISTRSHESISSVDYLSLTQTMIERLEDNLKRDGFAINMSRFYEVVDSSGQRKFHISRQLNALHRLDELVKFVQYLKSEGDDSGIITPENFRSMISSIYIEDHDGVLVSCRGLMAKALQIYLSKSRVHKNVLPINFDLFTDPNDHGLINPESQIVAAVNRLSFLCARSGIKPSNSRNRTIMTKALMWSSPALNLFSRMKESWQAWQELAAGLYGGSHGLFSFVLD